MDRTSAGRPLEESVDDDVESDMREIFFGFFVFFSEDEIMDYGDLGDFGDFASGQ
jgi:hypothetical protein